MMPSTEESGRPLDRRGVLKAAVWATPVVAVVASAPARAAGSPCADGYLDYELNWSSYTRASTTSATGTAFPVEGVGAPITVTLSAATTAGGITLANTGTYPNLGRVDSVVDIADSGAPRPLVWGIALSMTCPAANQGQNVAFTFSQPVENLAFAIGDIDNAGLDTPSLPFYRDGVALSPGGFWWDDGFGDLPAGSTGNGTIGNTWRVINSFNESWTTTGRREVRVDYAASLSAVTVQYRNTVNFSSPAPGEMQTVVVSPMYFQVACA